MLVLKDVFPNAHLSIRGGELSDEKWDVKYSSACKYFSKQVKIESKAVMEACKVCECKVER